MFENFKEVPAYIWIIIGALIFAGSAVLLLSGKKRKKNNWTAQTLTFGALSIALSFLLNLIVLYPMPQGGSVTPASMLPIMLFGYGFGPGPGIVAGIAYGLIGFIQKPWFLNGWQFLLDYIIGFGALGLTGFFYKKKEQGFLYAGIVISGFVRFLASFLSGIIFYGSYAAPGQSAFMYSLIYNGTYMIPEITICIVIAALAGRQLVGAMRRSL